MSLAVKKNGSRREQALVLAFVGMGASGASCSPGTGSRSAGAIDPSTGTGGGGSNLTLDGGIKTSGSSYQGIPNDVLCQRFGNLACKMRDCGTQTKTTVRAKVYDPAGKVPLYNVVVYVPNTQVDPIQDGVSCETCATPVSGQPIASALTDTQGQFTMENVPVGPDIPLVIQIGKWRREIAMPEILPCQINDFSDPELFRLPRNQIEGHIPRIAISTGEADSLECLLRRIGVADSEFTNPESGGRINLFYTPCVEGDCDAADSVYRTGQTFPSAWTSLWGSLDQLRVYDLVLMSCTGSQSAGRDVTSAQKQSLKNYLYAGGRAFLEHYHSAWLRGGIEDQAIEDARKYTQTPFPPLATWATAASPSIDVGSENYTPYSIDTSFSRGNDFAEWLANVGASPTMGTIDLMDVKHPALSVTPLSQRWVFSNLAVPYFTANTPFEASPEQQCGRLVHTGIHVAKVALDVASSPFPSGCKPEDPISAQEKAMEFLLFDLSSCILPPGVEQRPPTIVY